jgi:hypothetical protein
VTRAESKRRGQFDAEASQASGWQQAAREFVIAANYLIDWYDPPHQPGGSSDFTWLHSGSTVPMLVLYGTAVENLLKAILVAKGESLVAEGRLKPQFGHHRLLEYARAADLELTPEVAELLQRLSHVMYAGRYPTASEAGSSPGAWTLDYPADVERVWSVLEQLESVLRSTGTPCLPAVDLRARYRPPGYDLIKKP